jgi:outer membrane protein OmpA-like peptidoglycan-associated protein
VRVTKSTEDIMRFPTRSALAALVIGASLFARTEAHAQVQLFDEVPSVEQLRTILIPDSAPSASRRIIIPGREEMPRSQITQPASLTEAATQLPPPPSKASSASAPQAAADRATAPTEDKATVAGPVTSKIAGKDEAARAIGFRINFAFNSSLIPQDGTAYLDALAQLLNEERALTVSVEGHTDAVGSEAYNMELSKQRAESVTRYLVEHGVAREQLQPVGKGKSEPLVADPYDARNRRVQFNPLAKAAS